MQLPSEAELLRIFISESDKHYGRPLHEAIVHLALERGLAGATVLHGIMGFGAHSRVHTAKILRLSEQLPVVVEIVDTPEHIDEFLPIIDEMITEGLVTREKVNIIAYRHNALGEEAE
jgi:PII-like signaling protein